MRGHPSNTGLIVVVVVVGVGLVVHQQHEDSDRRNEVVRIIFIMTQTIQLKLS